MSSHNHQPQLAPIPVSAPTSTFHLTVVPANIATSIPYRQYCFAYDSCGGSPFFFFALLPSSGVLLRL